MVNAGRVGLEEAEALGGFLLPLVTASAEVPAPESWAELSAEVPKRGTYYLWGRVRFPGGPAESFRVVPTGAPYNTGAILLGGGADSRRWHWTPGQNERDGQPNPDRVALELAAGPWTFRVYPHRAAATTYAPLRWRQAELTQTPRLNLLCLTDDPNYVPTDADAKRALSLTPTPPPEPRVQPARLSPLPTEGPMVENRRRVPDWMRCPRWFTKDSWREELTTRQAGDIAALVRELAANGGETLRLSVFWGGEAYYQSRVAPHAPGLGELDYLREAMDEARRVGAKIVSYINPNALYPGHPLFPECVIREADGQVCQRPAYGAGFRPGALYPCANHPRYRQFLRAVLTEIFTRYQADGLYVDGLTPHLCFCEHCRAKWRALFGSDMPAAKLGRLPDRWAVWGEFGRDPQPVGDVENDPDARRLTEMLTRSLVEVTHEFSLTVKQARPGALTFFHSHPKPGSEADYDGTLTEVYSPQPWVHTAWRSGELAGYSAVYSVPVLFNVYPHRHFTEAEARCHALQGLAAGAYPNFWSAAGMKPVCEFMARCVEYLDFDTAAPVKFLALPRDLRESDTQRRAPAAPGVSYAPRDRFLAPYVGAYSALMRAGLPVVTLHRPHFEEQLTGFKVLVLANVALLSDAQAEAVRRFVREGGGLIATHETSLADEKGRRRADFALADLLGAHYRETLKSDKRQVVLAGDQEGRARPPGAPELPSAAFPAHDEPLVTVALDGAEAVGSLADGGPALLAHHYGKGRVVFLPGRFDSVQCYEPSPAIERLFANAVRWVAPEAVPVEIEAAGPVGLTLFRQPRRLIVHLINHQRDSRFRSDALEPIRRVALRVSLPEGGRAQSVRRLWENRDLPFQSAGRRVSIEVGALNEYEAVAIELNLTGR
jgi:hypothetical protein